MRLMFPLVSGIAELREARSELEHCRSELGRAGVNITDMALYPALDMSEGVIAMWIAGEEQARRTEELVASLGFPVARA